MLQGIDNIAIDLEKNKQILVLHNLGKQLHCRISNDNCYFSNTQLELEEIIMEHSNKKQAVSSDKNGDNVVSGSKESVCDTIKETNNL